MRVWSRFVDLLQSPVFMGICESSNQRFEGLFLAHFTRWLVPGGILVYTIPAKQLAACAKILAHYFRNLQVFRLESAECVAYHQVVVFGIARSQRERARTRHAAVSSVREHRIQHGGAKWYHGGPGSPYVEESPVNSPTWYQDWNKHYMESLKKREGK